MTQPNSPSVLHRPFFLASFPQLFLPFVLPIYAKMLGASALEIGGLFAAFTVSVIVIRPMVGVGLGRYGRRWLRDRRYRRPLLSRGLPSMMDTSSGD